MWRRGVRCAQALIFLAWGLAVAQTPVGPRTPGPEGHPLFGKREKPSEVTRSILGTVFDPEGKPVKGAIVQLKDLKTLRVRSFISLDDGSYRFHGLSMDNEYELQARHQSLESDKRRVTVFDSRRQVIIDLKLRPAREGEAKKDESS